MKPARVFNVAARLPEKLEQLRALAYNVHWSWDRPTIDLLRRLDRKLWEEVEHNPVRFLGMVSQETLAAAVEDEAFLAELGKISARLKEYMESPSWAAKTFKIPVDPLIAYFSAEFALAECLPVYSGGLGVLAGDVLKSSSDLGLPVVGVGLLYQQGYLTQYLNLDGWQQEAYTDTDFYNAPVSLVRRQDGGVVTIEAPHPSGPARAQLWRIQVGRVPLILLDTNIAANPPQTRGITGRLYEGDAEMRIQQEIMLGIGGMRALAALGYHPYVCHMNEGHSAFLALERIREMMERDGLNFNEARLLASAGTVFTTHTPVPAGSDHFHKELTQKYLGGYLGGMGLNIDDLMYWGRENQRDGAAPLCTTALAMRMASYTFAVSKLHEQTSRHIWGSVWTNVPPEDVPITGVTNGVHNPTWVSKEIADLFDRYLGPRWRSQPSDTREWERVKEIPDEELWQVHEFRRQRLVRFARLRLRDQLARRGGSPMDIEGADEVLHPHALTIVVARRFASYKRGNLLFHDLERLKNILDRVDRPVQIILAGKAHPADKEGKELIRSIVHHLRDKSLRRRALFIENYDMCVARYLVQGADIWLNTPRRPLEASGTSGMKAAANGALNLSILDGWWCEGYEPDTGWAVGQGEEYDDPHYQDAVEAEAIYDLLDKEIIPLFYERDVNGIPRGWVAKMKASIINISPFFNANRMAAEYMQKYYIPASERTERLRANNFERTRKLAGWQANIRRNWQNLAVLQVNADDLTNLQVGASMKVRALVRLGGINPDDIAVDLYIGHIDGHGEMTDAAAVRMKPEGGGNDVWFSGEYQCRSSGRHGYAIRVVPSHEDLVNPYEMNLVTWA